MQFRNAEDKETFFRITLYSGSFSTYIIVNEIVADADGAFDLIMNGVNDRLLAQTLMDYFPFVLRVSRSEIATEIPGFLRALR